MVVREALGTLSAVALEYGQTVPLVGRFLRPERRLDLSGRVVFVTGAGRGLGSEVARQAYACGAFVSLIDRHIDPAQTLATELGDRAAAFLADVTDAESLHRAADATVTRFGGIDVVIANAAIGPPATTVLTTDPTVFESVVDTNLLGPWRTIHATLPAVIERRGHVLVVASVYAVVNGAMNASYAASKAGLEQLVRSLRVELAGHGTTAGVAYFGFIDTQMARQFLAQPHIQRACQALPSIVTTPISVQTGGRTVIEAIERRSARSWSPAWVAPLLAFRSLSTTVMDEYMLRNSDFAQAIQDAER